MTFATAISSVPKKSVQAVSTWLPLSNCINLTVSGVSLNVVLVTLKYGLPVLTPVVSTPTAVARVATLIIPVPPLSILMS